MPSRLAEIYRQERKTGGSLGSAVGKSIKEKIDPRQIIDPKGIIATLFPSLRAYRATPERELKSATPQISELSSKDFSEMSGAMKVTAKNTLSIPMMARDINLIKTNIFKMTRSLGQTPETKKTDIFWKNAQQRESMLESAMKSVRKTSGFMGLSPTSQKQKRDGQTKETALFVKADLSITDMMTQAALGSAAGGAAGGVLGKLKKLLPFVFKSALPVLGIAGIASLLYFLIRKDSGEPQTMEEMQAGGGYTPDMGGTAGPAAEPATKEELSAVRENMRNSDDPAVRAAAAELDRQDTIKALPNQSEAESRRLGLSSAPAAPTTPTPATENVPSNVVRSGSGEPIRTGSGGFLTSGEETSPTKVGSASIPSASGLPIDYKSYAQKIGEKESGGNYKAVNTLGYLGKYQFGAMALQDMGLVKKGTSLKGLDNPANWNIEGGKQSFLNNPQLQEDTMLRYTKQNLATLNRIGVVNKDSSPQDIAGYLAASHLLGPGGARDLSKGKVGADAYGTSSASYFKVGSATQGAGSAVSLASSTPTSGPSVSTASSSVADGQRQVMTPSGGGSTVIDNSTRTTMASSDRGGKTASTYDEDLIRTLVATAA
jgi:hypothetical protein